MSDALTCCNCGLVTVTVDEITGFCRGCMKPDEEYVQEAPPECMACDDTGYEPGMPGFYCTFCKAGRKVAIQQVKEGRNPFDPFGDEAREREESDADKRYYADWPCEATERHREDKEP